jgi:hypothetical protein
MPSAAPDALLRSLLSSYRARMSSFRRLVFGVVALALAVVALVPGAPRAQGKALDDLMMDLSITPLEPQASPPLTVSTLAGDRLSLADLKGQAVLLYFMATW